MKLSAVISYKNCIQSGYPFAESILSMLPIVDEYLVNDGGSTDGTLEATKRLVEMYPDKIKLYQINDFPCTRWHCVSDQYNKLIEDATGDWIFQGNADEIMHENDIGTYKAALGAAKPETIVLRHLRHEIFNYWSETGWYDYWPARVTRNIEGVFQDWPSLGGDEFIKPKWTWMQFPPDCERLEGFKIWHYYMMFIENNMEKMRHDSEDVATSDKHRAQQFEFYKVHPYSLKVPEWYGVKVVPNQPGIIKDMVTYTKYSVREELFDPAWLKKIYTVSQ